MELIKRRRLLFVSLFLFALSLLIRYRIRGLFNQDMIWIGNWYEHLYENGWKGLADPTFSNYPPAYLYLLWISTLFSRWFGPLVSIKLIPTFFDFISAFVVFLMAKLRYKGDVPYLFSAAFFILPTIMINSSAWGQIDSLYTSFLLLCIYLILREKPFAALVAFGIAFSFKAQAIFLVPFLGLMLLKGRVAWYHFLIVPVVYLAFGVPAALIGRDWQSIISLYMDQFGQFRDLAKNAPNLYLFIPNAYYDVATWLGMIVFVAAMSAWAWINWRSKISLGMNKVILMALTSLVLVPFLLPKMHDRYFYPADVVSFALIIFYSGLWFVPILYQLVSGLAYTNFLFEMPVYLVQIAAVINTFVVFYVLRRQILSIREEDVREYSLQG